eukprot:SAG31_NODE_2460_length_5658_cov_8.348084_2_plen_916_part_00
MRADGTSFLLKFSAGAGLTYQVLAILRAGSAAAHLRLAIFPPEAIGSASSTGAASGSSCRLPPAAQDSQSQDVTEMTFGTWGSPTHGQTWGEQHRCEDLTRVGPPESQPAGCGGQYRYFPGQSFPSNHTWDWTAPFTANYVLQVTANCDVPFYDDPTQPGCTVTADGIDCEDDAVTQCLAAIGLTIRVVDRSVHVKHTFDVPVTQEVLDSIELQQRMADMFALQQQPAIVFPLSITPLDCGLAENAERPGCQQTAALEPGGGHRRRRLQTQIGADTDHACPQSSFDTRDTAMRTSCGFQSSDAADPLLQGSCPSLECARALLPLLEDCAEHVAEFARHIGPEAAFYEALGRSEMFADCEEMEQAAAQFASVQVEFRAPTLEVANQMILEHQQMVSKMFLPTSQGDGGRQLCFGNSDPSVADGTRCGRRRQLGGEELCAEVCADKDERIRQLEAELERSKVELEKSKAETEAAIQRSAEKDRVIERYRAEVQGKDQLISQQVKTIDKQANEIAFHKRLHRLRQHAVTRQNVFNDSTLHNQQAVVGRRAQASSTSDSLVLRSARVGADRSVKACVVHPCELGDRFCQNGGTCIEVVAEVGGAVPFECQCVNNFAGERCETDLRALFTVVSGPCTVSDGGRCVGRPDGYLPNEECEILVSGESGMLGPCAVFDIDYALDPNDDDYLTLPDGTQRTGPLHGDIWRPEQRAGGCPIGKILVPHDILRWHSSPIEQGKNGNGLPQSRDGLGGGWQICFAKPTIGLPSWDSGDLRSTGNPAGAAFMLYKLPAVTFSVYDGQGYADACAEYGLQPIGCYAPGPGPDQWSDLTQYQPHGLHMPAEFGCTLAGSCAYNRCGAESLYDPSHDLGSLTGWSNLLFFSTGMASSTEAGLDGMATDQVRINPGSGHSLSPVCALAIPLR